MISGEIADLTKTAKHPSGISIFTDDTKETYASTYEVLRRISEIWNEMTDKQQASLAEKLFGKTRAQAGLAILSNFEQVEKALATMKESAGSADREMAIIEESIEFKLNRLKETWTGFWQKLFKREDLANIVDGMTAFSEGLQNITSALGPVGTALAAIPIGTFLVSLMKGEVKLKELGKMFINLPKSIGNAWSKIAGFFTTFMAGMKGATEIAAANGATGITGGLLSVGINPWLAGITAAVAALGLLAVGINYASKAGERATKKMQESANQYQTTKEKIEDVNKQLESNSARIDELQSKGTLSFIEQGELEKLKIANERLESILKVETARAKLDQRKLEKDAMNAFELNYGKGTTVDSIKANMQNINDAQKQLEEMIQNGASEEEHTEFSFRVKDLVDKDPVSKYLLQRNKKRKELAEVDKRISEETNAEELDRLGDQREKIQAELDETDTNLYSKRDELQGILDNLIPTTENYKMVEAIITYIDRVTDPNAFNSKQIDSIFDNKKLKVTKEQLIEMAKKGKFDESTIRRYQGLADAIDNLDLELDEGTDKWQVFINEMYAAPEASNVAEESIKTTENAMEQQVNQLVDYSNAFSDAHTKMVESITEYANSGTLSANGINSLTEALEKLGITNEEVASTFVLTETGMHINYGALEQLISSKGIEHAEGLNDTYNELNQTLTDQKFVLASLQHELMETTDSDRRDSIKETIESQKYLIDQTEREIASIAQLRAEYGNITSAYSEFQRALQAPNQGAHYDNMLSQKENMEKMAKEYRFGVDELQSYVKYWTGESIVDTDLETDKRISKKAFENAKKYSTEDFQGLNNLKEDLEKIAKANEDSGMSIEGNTLKIEDMTKAAESAGISVSALEDILKKMEEYKINVDFSNTFEGLSTTSAEFEKLQKLLQDKRLQRAQMITAHADTTQIDAELAELEKAYENYNLTIGLSVDVKNAIEEIVSLQKEIEEIQNSPSYGSAGSLKLMESKEAKQKELAEKYNLDLEAILHINVPTDDESKIDEIGEAIKSVQELAAKGAEMEIKTPGSDALKTVLSDFQKIKAEASKEVVMNVKVNYTDNKNNPFLKNAKESTESSTSGGSGANGQNNSGAAKVNGQNNHPAGSAFVDGKNNDLVGELGPELRIRDGQYELLGVNGPEMTDVKPDDIIFDHKQTDDLLKKGHTNKRGKAFAKGKDNDLVGELGPELRVDVENGEYELLGKNGPEFTDVKPSDIIYTADQTDDILSGDSYAGGKNEIYKTGAGVDFSGFKELNKKAKQNKKEEEEKKKATEKNTKATEKNTKAIEEEKKEFEWLDRAFDLRNDEIERVLNKAEKESESDDERKDAYNIAIEKLNDLLIVAKERTNRRREDYERLKGEAVKSLGQDQAMKLIDKIENGNFNIDEWKDEFKYTGPTDDSEEAKAVKKAWDEQMELIDKLITADDNLLKSKDAETDVVERLVEQQEKLYEIDKAYYESQVKWARNVIDDKQIEIDIKNTTGKIVSAADYEEMIDASELASKYQEEMIERMYDRLGELEDPDSAQYRALQQEIIEVERELANATKQQNEWNETIIQLPIDHIEAYIENLKTAVSDLDNYSSIIEARGNSVTASVIKEQINIQKSIAEQYAQETEMLEKKLKNYTPGSDKWNETFKQLQSIDDEISSIVKSMIDFNKQLLALPVDKLNKVASALSNIQDGINKKQADNQAVIDAAIAVLEKSNEKYQDEIEAIQDEQKELDKVIKKKQEIQKGLEKEQRYLEDQKTGYEDIQYEIAKEIEKLERSKEPLEDRIKLIQRSMRVFSDEERILQWEQEDLQHYIELLQRQQEDMRKAADDRIEPLQDELDILNKQNEARDRQLRIEQAAYNLQKAREQKTVQVVKNGRIVYEADQENVRQAQNEYAEAEYNLHVGNLQDEIDKINDDVEDAIGKIDDEIDGIERDKLTPISDRLYEIGVARRNYELEIDYLEREMEPIDDQILNLQRESRYYDDLIKPIDRKIEMIGRESSNIGREIEDIEEIKGDLDDKIDGIQDLIDKNDDILNKWQTLQKEVERQLTIEKGAAIAGMDFDEFVRRILEEDDEKLYNETRDSYEEMAREQASSEDYSDDLATITSILERINEKLLKGDITEEEASNLAKALIAAAKDGLSGAEIYDSWMKVEEVSESMADVISLMKNSFSKGLRKDEITGKDVLKMIEPLKKIALDKAGASQKEVDKALDESTVGGQFLALLDLIDKKSKSLGAAERSALLSSIESFGIKKGLLTGGQVDSLKYGDFTDTMDEAIANTTNEKVEDNIFEIYEQVAKNNKTIEAYSKSFEELKAELIDELERSRKAYQNAKNAESSGGDSEDYYGGEGGGNGSASGTGTEGLIYFRSEAERQEYNERHGTNHNDSDSVIGSVRSHLYTGNDKELWSEGYNPSDGTASGGPATTMNVRSGNSDDPSINWTVADSSSSTGSDGNSASVTTGDNSNVTIEQSSGGSSGGPGDYVSGGSSVSGGASYSDGGVTYSSHADGIESGAIKKYATGLMQGAVGPTADERVRILQELALKKLKPAEVPSILDIGEVVMNPAQQMRLLDNFSGALASAQNVATSAIQNKNPEQNFTFTMGDVHLHEVNNADDFAKAITMQFPAAMRQRISSMIH